MTEQKRSVLDSSAETLTEALKALGQPAFRAKQIYRQVYLNLKSLDAKTLQELLEAARMSTSRPVGTSRDSSDSLH